MFNELQGAKDNFIKLNPAQNIFYMFKTLRLD